MESHFNPCPKSHRLVGDPIDVVTGAHTDAAVDVRLPGPIPFRWVRCYSSARSTVECPLGWGQTHDYDRTLHHDLDGLLYVDPFGSTVGFPPLDIGQRSAKAGLCLRRISENVYELAQASQPTLLFEFGNSSDLARLSRLQYGESVIRFRYDQRGRLCQIVDSLGRSIDVESNTTGRITGLFLIDVPQTRRALMTYEYDSAGNPVLGRDVHHATLLFCWDQHNRLTGRTDRRGYSFYFAYDEQGRCIHSRGEDGLLEVFLDYRPELHTTQVRRGDGGEWIYAYNTSGTLTQIIDPYGGKTLFVLDETGRVTEELDPAGNRTRLLYDHTGRHFARLDPLGYLQPTYAEVPTPPDPLAYELPDLPMEWEHGHLLRGRTECAVVPSDPMFRGFPPNVLSSCFSSHAEPVKKAHPSEDSTDSLVPTEAASPLGAARTADCLQRKKYDPNGNLVEYQDQDGAIYRYVYTSWNALHQEIDPLGFTTVFHHMGSGLVDRVQDAGGTVTEYTYDQKDRLVEVRRHGRVRERYAYDAAANVVQKTDGQGLPLLKWKIGSASLALSRQLSSGEVHDFQYDLRGRIVSAATPEGVTTFAFTDDGSQVADLRDGVGVTHEQLSRQLVATTYLDKFRVSYQCSDGGDLNITDPTGANHRILLSAPGIIVKHLASGVHELCVYDTLGRCCHKALTRHNGPPWMRSFRYSRAGDFLGVTDTLQGQVLYRHDKAHRLADETLADGTRRHFVFDAVGNLLAQPGLTGVQLGAGNRLHMANGDRFSYDARDHLSLREGPSGKRRYEYNALDLLVHCDINGESWTAEYDGLCRRTQKTWRGRTTTYYWDDFRLAAELRPNGSVRIYIYEDQVALVPFLFVEYPSLSAAPNSGTRYYIFTNQIGVPVRVEDDSGRLCWIAQIDPFGRAEVGPTKTVDMPLRFPGHYYDSETGLHYNRFRYFSPELGRYLQSDPAGLEGGINLYAYPADPLTSADIDGLAKRGGGGGRSNKLPSSRRSGKSTEGTPGGKTAGCPLSTSSTKANDKPKRGTPEGDEWRYKRYTGRGGKLSKSEWGKRNKGGRGGGANHAAIQKELASRPGYDKEVVIGGRAADAYKPYTVGPPPKKGEIHQIGGLNKRGDPISRERDAINDMQKDPEHGPDKYDIHYHDKNSPPDTPAIVNPQNNKNWGG
jgi:RHS repeat-associated protein